MAEDEEEAKASAASPSTPAKESRYLKQVLDRYGGPEETRTEEKADQLRALQKYVENMVYNIWNFPQKDTPRTERLAKTVQFKARTKKTDKKPKIIPIENIEELIEEAERREQIKLKARRRRKQLFHSILQKLKSQWHENFMKLVIKKFADYMAEKTTNFKVSPMSTEARQRLIRGIVCNMFFAMGINKDPCAMEHALYDTMGYVLADLLLEAQFMVQYKVEPPIPEEEPHPKCVPVMEKLKKPKKFSKGSKKNKPTTTRKKVGKLPEDLMYLFEIMRRRKFNECAIENKKKQVAMEKSRKL